MLNFVFFYYALFLFVGSFCYSIDDVILVGNDLNDVHTIKGMLHLTFKIKDLRHLKFFLRF